MALWLLSPAFYRAVDRDFYFLLVGRSIEYYLYSVLIAGAERYAVIQHISDATHGDFYQRSPTFQILITKMAVKVSADSCLVLMVFLVP